MFAVMPLSSPTHVAALRPVSGSHDVSVTDVSLFVAAVAFFFVTLAPTIANPLVAVAGIGAIAWLGLRVADSMPRALVDAHMDALARATATQISFAR